MENHSISFFFNELVWPQGENINIQIRYLSNFKVLYSFIILCGNDGV
jgi:hypothetical protein